MVQTDKEISREYNNLNNNLIKIKRNIKYLGYLDNMLVVIGFICICLIIIGICRITKNMLVIFFSSWFFFIFICVLFYVFSKYIKKTIESLTNKQIITEKTIEDLLDFSAYILACRQIEAKQANKDIYPEFRYNDSLSIQKEFKDKFEDKRIEYEKHHIERLKLNPYYLDEKLSKAPINTYPIHEQELLEKRQKELKNSK